jgi:class 3 adenylate cyclase/tetratricopeptide (TPR) repeat protein
MDVGEWLKGLGLGEYEDKFRHNKIDADVLADLSDGDLEKLGLPLGDRKRFLKAVAGLAAPSSAVTRPEPAQAQPLASTPTHSTSAERRPITVMFCDLVGSTALAAKLDAEDWRSLVNAYLDEASAAVSGLGGHVLKRLGDGLMALFGYPQAQENDAERAVRAALAIQRALGELNARNAARGAPALSARIGLESGPVVVEAAGEVFGNAPNVAARVQSLAEPGSVLITMNVQRQVAGLFVVEEQGVHELKGVAEPVQLFRILRASGGGRRGGQRTLTPFVGREEELAVLTRRWERARAGEGQLVLIVGEPGLGKSRLMEQFRAGLAETPHTWAEWSASQLLQNTPLHPIAEWGRQRFGGADAPADKRFAELELTLRQVKLDAEETAPLLAPLLDIPLPPGRAVELAPEEMRRRQLAAVVSWVLASARTQPLVLAFEDLHWADPTSIEVLRALAERGAQAPLLLVATARPEFRPPWSMRAHHSAISLSPLDRAEVRKMVGVIASRHALSKDVVEGVGERTGGVPLFIEEVTRLLLERGEQGGVQAIPPTLQQSLAARLDRLGEARETAQIGAVLGRRFSQTLLRAVADIDERALQSALDRLAEADILIVEGAGEQANFRFKHALIQDAAYDSLLKSRRQSMHERAAEILRDGGADPEIIAHHFTQASLHDLAIEWWGKAGDQALRRSAFQEAIAHLGKAIAMADNAGDATARATAGDAAAISQRLKLQTGYHQAALYSRGFTSEETKAAVARATELAATTGDFLERFAAFHGQWTLALTRGELRSAREQASKFLREALEAGRAVEAGVARRGLALACYFAGDFDEARTHCERLLDDSDPQHDQEAREHWAEDTRATGMSVLAVTMWQLGEVDRARELIEQANWRASGLGHAPSMAHPLLNKSYLEMQRGDAAAALVTAEALVALSREHGMTTWRAVAELYAVMARCRLHDPAASAAAAVLAEQGEGGWLVIGALLRARLAELEAEIRGAERALARIDEAVAFAHQGESRCDLPFLHRLRGDILLKHDSSNPAKAEEAYWTAIAIAQQQGARSYQLLASLSLARLYQSTARLLDAHAVLSDALEGFAPTPEMPEIAEAQTLLAALDDTSPVMAEAAQRERKLHLQTVYGQAMMYSKGFASDESKTAFARARALAAGVGGADERFDAYYGLFVGSVTRGELSLAQETAESFLREAENEGRMAEAVVARRSVGQARLYQGNFLEAQKNFAEALRTYDPERDRDAKFRFGADGAAATTGYLTLAIWALGDVERAKTLAEEALARADETAHAPTRVNVYNHISLYQMLRGDPEAVRNIAWTAVALSREHGMAMYLVRGEVHSHWSHARLGERESGMTGLRKALAAYLDRGNKLYAPLLQGLLAELEAEGGDADGALRRIDEALALASETGECWTDAPLHRIRGEILLKRDPANPAPAEEAFLAAIAIAQAQKARSFELQAALSLAKLYQSTARPLEAHAVLSDALEGFAPTPEMPEIAEAQALLSALAETDEVKAAAAQKQRQAQLQVAYGNALIAVRGFGAPETTEAFARAHESASGEKDAPERLAANFGIWAGSYTRGELPSMRAYARTFLADVEAKPDSPEAGVAHRLQGITHWFAGEYREARERLERALALFQPGRDDDMAIRFGPDPGVSSMAYLAFVCWPLGEIDHAISLVDRMSTRMAGLSNANTLALGKMYAAQFALMRGGQGRLTENALELAKIAREYDLAQSRAFGVFFLGWARAESDLLGGLEEMRRGAEILREQNILVFDGVVKIALAKAEAKVGDLDRALSIVNEALATANRLDFRAFEAELHRTRGEFLLERDQTNPVPAEEAFLAAIAVAQAQKARSFELRAALTLAKLYQSTARPAEAHAVLAPALEGFSPTPEMPEIAEAQALQGHLA